MTRRRLHVLFLTALSAGCAGEPPASTRAALGSPEATQIVFQAVDAGTGGALADAAMTVRYLARTPVTLDAVAVQRVPSTDAYTIRHDVAEDSLVVEVRLEAASYHRLDTVLSVGRGGEAGPYTLRMARRLERSASRPTGGARPAGAPARADATPATGGASGLNRGLLDVADRSFAAGRWLEAIQGYQRVVLPDGASDADVRAYQAARIRQGRSHMELGEYAGALDALEEAAGLSAPSGEARLRLAQAQCAVGRVDQGRRTIAEMERGASGLDPRERASALVVGQYVSALCGMGELDQAETAIERVRVGGRIVQELQGFLDAAGGASPRTDYLDAAVTDAQERIEAIRERMRRGG